MDTFWKLNITVIITVIFIYLSLSFGTAGTINDIIIGVLASISISNALLNNEITKIGRIAGGVLPIMSGLLLFVIPLIDRSMVVNGSPIFLIIMSYFILVMSVIIVSLLKKALY